MVSLWLSVTAAADGVVAVVVEVEVAVAVDEDSLYGTARITAWSPTFISLKLEGLFFLRNFVALVTFTPMVFLAFV